MPWQTFINTLPPESVLVFKQNPAKQITNGATQKYVL